MYWHEQDNPEYKAGQEVDSDVQYINYFLHQWIEKDKKTIILRRPASGWFILQFRR
jgi:hypothetical protein